jgi:hypothetical protein
LEAARHDEVILSFLLVAFAFLLLISLNEDLNSTFPLYLHPQNHLHNHLMTFAFALKSTFQVSYLNFRLKIIKAANF